jgi:hypothetical protein
MAVSRGGHFLFESSPLLRCVGGGNLFEETPRDGGWGIGGEVQLRARVHLGLLEARSPKITELINNRLLVPKPGNHQML